MADWLFQPSDGADLFAKDKHYLDKLAQYRVSQNVGKEPEAEGSAQGVITGEKEDDQANHEGDGDK